MIEIKGKVLDGSGNASGNFQKGNIEKRIASFLGVPEITSGTLNVIIEMEYSSLDNGKYDDFIDAKEYNGREWIKIKRCKLNGFKCVIIRPYDHFHVDKFKKRIEIMSSERLRDKFNIADGDKVEIEFQGDDDWWLNSCPDDIGLESGGCPSGK